MEKANRREFIKKGVTAGAAMKTVAAASLTAASANRVLGANERLQIGIIGCGGRGCYHIGWLHRSSRDVDINVIAAADIWQQKVDRAAGIIKERFEIDAKKYRDYHKLLDNKDIDGVVIATADHQHCPMLINAVQAGKDAYVEKPIATYLDELNKTNDVVMASDRIVQHGTQGRSSQGAIAAHRFVHEGKLGKLLRVEECRSHYAPYWNNYQNPEKKDTNWNAFLYNRPFRPFQADQHGAWMGYAEFSPGTIGGWMSHFSDFIHYVTGSSFPVSAIAHGGIYATTSKEERTCPDTVTAILDYAEGFSTSFTTHFGNAANDYRLFFGSKGIMRINAPDGNARGGIAPRVSGEGSDHPEKIAEEKALEETPHDDHMTNWLKCMKSREEPNAHMGAGYMQGVAVLLGWRAYEEERKMIFDPVKREIRPA